MKYGVMEILISIVVVQSTKPSETSLISLKYQQSTASTSHNGVPVCLLEILALNHIISLRTNLKNPGSTVGNLVEGSKTKIVWVLTFPISISAAGFVDTERSSTYVVAPPDGRVVGAAHATAFSRSRSIVRLTRYAAKVADSLFDAA